MKVPTPHLRALPPPVDEDSGTFDSCDEVRGDVGMEVTVPLIRAKTQRTLLANVGRIALLFAISIVAASLVGPRLVGVELPVGPEYEGQVARVHVRADRDYVVVDQKATENLRGVRERESRSVWDLDLARAKADANHVASAFTRVTESLRLHSGRLSALVDVHPDDTQDLRSHAEPQGEVPSGNLLSTLGAVAPLEQVRARLAGDLALIGVEAPRDDVWESLRVVLSGAPEARETLLGAIRDGLSRPVVADRGLLSRDAKLGIVIRPVPSSFMQEESVLEKVDMLPDVETARRNFQVRLRDSLWNSSAGFSQEHVARVAEWASSLLRSTLTYNATESANRRSSVRASVPDKTIRIFRGEMVLHPGELITPRHLLVLAAMDKQQGDELRARAALGSGAFVLLVCWFTYRFGVRGVFRRTLDTRDLWVLGGVLNLTLLLIYCADRMIVPVSEAMRAFSFDVPPLAVVCAVPIAWGAMQVTLLISAEVALLFAVLIALLGGVMAEPGTTWTLVSLVSSLTAVAMVERIERRKGLLICGFWAGAAAGLTAATLELFRGAMTEEQLLTFMASAVVGGVFSGLLSALGTPLAETFLGYETHLRLKSLADANQPLLKDLLVHAPGTWRHSVRTAALCEAACRAIGADAALSRVMALYHDVGKIQCPYLFPENREDARVDVDEISVAEQERMWRAHVDEGRRLAKKARLPRAVLRAIATHHGKMPLFGASIHHPKTEEEHVTRPLTALTFSGPLPASKESAVLMLADQLEHALYEDKGRSPLNLVDQVTYLLQHVQESGSLRESSLTFQDLERIRLAFIETVPELPQLMRKPTPIPGGAGEVDDVVFDG